MTPPPGAADTLNASAESRKSPQRAIVVAVDGYHTSND